MKRERWKQIKGAEFLVSSHGRIWSHARRVRFEIDGKTYWRNKKGRLVGGNVSNMGYFRVRIGDDLLQVHSIVAVAFLGDFRDTMTVNHKNLNKLDNRVDNLEWLSAADNVVHAWENGACDVHCMPVRCIDTGEEYSSIKQAAESVGLPWGALSAHLKGKKKQFGGYVWERLKAKRYAA